MKKNEVITNSLCDILRDVATSIDEFNIGVQFVKNDCPFVDKASEAIEHGGQIEAICLSSLVHYIADMMEQ
jgi:hypothetical protein